MIRKKTRAIVGVPDGSDGMRQLSDRRFEKGDWLEQSEFAGGEADTWLQYLAQECRRRDLQCAGISQIDARENSGSYTIRPIGPDPQPELVVVWERKRDGPLIVRSRLTGAPLFDEELAKAVLNGTTEACKSARKERVFCAGYLLYDGLLWHGEHWLEPGLRLGTPPREYTEALVGPRVVLVETVFDGVDIADARAGFRVFLRELSAFLSVALRMRIGAPGFTQTKTWVWTTDSDLKIECDVRQLGYEIAPPRNELPIAGIEAAVPNFVVTRPDLVGRGITGMEHELALPSDLNDLWAYFRALPPAQRRQFLQVASLWQLSNALVGEFDTASVAYLVAACEALKPADAVQRLNAYDVVETTLGKELADRLRSELQPVRIRHAHFHAGEIRGDEFRKLMMMDSFRDPKFRQVFDEMWLVTAACIVEWLMRDGVLAMATESVPNWVERTRRYRLGQRAWFSES